MAKGIIVVDVPERCGDCVFSNPDGDYCPFRGEISYPEYGDKKPDCCPIRSVSEKRRMEGAHTFTDLGFVCGWNACIDEILK